MGQKKPKP